MFNSVVFREDGNPLDFLIAIGDLEGGSDALADYFSERWSRVEAFARTGTFDTFEDDGEIISQDHLMANAYTSPKIDIDEVSDQDWMQVAWLLRYECHDLFIEMLMVLRAKVRSFEAGQEDVTPFDEDLEDSKIETSDSDRGKATQPRLDADEESAI